MSNAVREELFYAAPAFPYPDLPAWDPAKGRVI